MKHPIKEMNINQEEFISFLPEDQKEKHRQAFRIGNACYIYHQSAEKLEPTKEDFKEWLEGLPTQPRKDFERKGFENCLGVLSFTRYVNEKNDIGLDTWLQKHLSQEDYKMWISQNK